MEKPQGWRGNLGARKWDERKLPRIVLIFEDENSLRRVDCNDQNFHELMIFLYIRNVKFVSCVYVNFYENYEY